jgi:hypothetical protein
MMCRVIDNCASCEAQAVICSLYTKTMSTDEIHCELCTVYSKNVMSEEL